MSHRDPAGDRETDRLRVVIVAESALPYLSGVTIATDALARGLMAAGHRALVLAPRPSDPTQPIPAAVVGSDYERRWLTSYQLPRPVPPGYRMPWPFRQSGAVRDALAFAPHIVHSQSPFYAGRLARRIARRAGVPLVFTHHTRFADYRHYLGPFGGGQIGDIVVRLLERQLLGYWRRCDAVVAPSEELAAAIRARLAASAGSRGGHAPPVSVIPGGIDVGAIAAIAPIDPRPIAGWPDDSVVVVSHGRLAREKSVEVIVDAVALIAERAPALHLLLVGGGPLLDELRSRAATAGVAERVHLTGPQPRDRALALVRGSDLFAFASRTETQGLVLAEALAAGVPVVAVDGPAIRESLRDGEDGVVVAADPPAGRVERLADTIAALAADPSRRATLAAGAAAGARRFDVSLRTADMVALYRRLLAGPPPGDALQRSGPRVQWPPCE